MKDFHFISLTIALFSGGLLAVFLTPQVGNVLNSEIPDLGYRTLTLILTFTALVYIISGLQFRVNPIKDETNDPLNNGSTA